MFRKVGISLLLTLSVGLIGEGKQAHAQNADTIQIDASAPAHPFPHFWEHMFGSGRAVLSLRESYRSDLRDVKKITDVQYIRFHGILMDELQVYDEDEKGNVVYNFSYIDQIYDGLLQNGVRPFVELSFMPKKLASKNNLHAFWYKQNVSPPKDWDRWDDLIFQFTKHLVDRYGVKEVSSWYFEVWNEPNIDFWAGDPKQASYWELYDHTVKAVKRANESLRVGGPSTAQASWVDALIKHCKENNVPLDFVSTHVYGNDSSPDVFGTHEVIARDKFVCRAVKKVHDQIQASDRPTIPLIWSEFNASFFNEPAVTDSTYMGPWMADTIRQCDGLVNEMSYWTFSDVFEEQGVVKRPFYGGFGLIAAGDIPKPAFNTFKVLHFLGDTRIELNSDSALVTQRKNGTLVIALWNLVAPEASGPAKTLTLEVKNAKVTTASIWHVDRQHGDVRVAYEAMGSPQYPTTDQLAKLRKAAELPGPEKAKLNGGKLSVEIPAQGLVVIELK
ncbi:MAG: glycosyl hydrolase family 39 [Acidobacteriota bacterium]|nr:glycosyl hydrolase family 39 [Acidobacteriota bacterium]